MSKSGERAVNFRNAKYYGIIEPHGFEAFVLYLFGVYGQGMKYFFQSHKREANVISVRESRILVNQIIHTVSEDNPQGAKAVIYFFGLNKYKRYNFFQLEKILEEDLETVKKIFYSAIKDIRNNHELKKKLKGHYNNFKKRADKRAYRIIQIRRDPEHRAMLYWPISKLGLPSEIEEKIKKAKKGKKIERVIDLVRRDESTINSIWRIGDKSINVIREELYQRFLEFGMTIK